MKLWPWRATSKIRRISFASSSTWMSAHPTTGSEMRWSLQMKLFLVFKRQECHLWHYPPTIQVKLPSAGNIKMRLAKLDLSPASVKHSVKTVAEQDYPPKENSIPASSPIQGMIFAPCYEAINNILT